MQGSLYIVATPIGNLKDLTIRAKETLESVDVVVCEDTRVTSKLMASIGAKKTLLAINQHADDKRLSSVVSRLLKGENIAYVSDAGTPGVNDPGGKLVEEALKEGITVVPVPGASALTAAISVCAFPMERFTYLGFAPHKKGRQTFFKEIAEREDASIFFESTHRLLKALESLTEVLGEKRLVFVGRELTKLHETLYRGTASEVLDAIKATSDKGEAVIVIAPKKYYE
ncbi:MAG: 16S rRNA (cytidine(1402)-2'-O)-methyltransferase [Patescibacteria group bacterium]|nr:16S rRNA (cytidine(1402)-2'-O)-methyltransferase [Patescibacteria group bacterium]